MDNISGNVIANGVYLHYYRTMGGKPPIVLIHGVTDDGLCWTRVADQLADRYDLIMLDLRGHGKSEAPDTGYTLTVMAAEIVALIKELGLMKPILLGHSMGAITALALAGLYPDVAKAIIMEDPPTFWMVKKSDKSQPPHPNGLALWIEANKRKTKEELFSEVRSGNPGWSDAEIDPWVDSKLRYSPKIVQMVSMTDLPAMDFDSLLKHITCKTLLLTADPSKGSIVTEKEAAVLSQTISQLEIRHIDGAGHNIHRDQFESYMDIVQDYLAKLG
jgi:N-formylmaleamate deformylase